VVIEDDPDIGETMNYALSRAGFYVLVAERGGLGFDAACRGADLVVVDLNLPDVDGLEICRMLRRRLVSMKTPILIASARSEERDLALGREAGADDYLVKPFSLRDLVQRCRALIQRRFSPLEPS
jgi:DNA-binding response OmpR family regulator